MINDFITIGHKSVPYIFVIFGLDKNSLPLNYLLSTNLPM
ncbi:hypothetical protein SALWKB12_0196 [Snodgrassella communis]|nr:hypothetical protein SALWKB12_0196 [Snodgrassella communis]